MESQSSFTSSSNLGLKGTCASPFDQEPITEIELNKFNFEQDSTYVVCSKRNSGKSVLVIDLIYHLTQKHKYNSIVLFSKTANFSIKNDWSFIQNKYIFEGVDDNIIQEIMDHQKSRIKQKNNENTHIMLVFDDLALHKKSKMLEELFTLGRHMHITTIVSVQYCKNLISPTIRGNIDYLFFSVISNDSIDPIYRSIYTKMNLKDFYQFLHTHNKNFQFVFYNNKHKSDQDKFFTVKAQLRSNLKLTRKKKEVNFLDSKKKE